MRYIVNPAAKSRKISVVLSVVFMSVEMHSAGKKKVVSVGPFRFTGRILGKGNFARVEEAVHAVLNIKVG